MSIFEKSKEGLTTTTYHDDGKQCVVERNINYKPIIEHNCIKKRRTTKNFKIKIKFKRI